jgi:peptidoglycan-associated lipoprotein
MRIDCPALVRFGLIATAAASLAACGTAKAPQALVINDSPPPPPSAVAPTPQPRTEVNQAPSASLPPPRVQTPQVQPPGVGPGSLQDFVINVGDRVYFDYDQYSIRADARPVLDAQAAWLNRYQAVTIRIEGNADERGTQEYNFALAERRANSVRDYLVGRGVAASRIQVVSYGKERPIDGGSNEEAWQRNRNGHTAILAGAR